METTTTITLQLYELVYITTALAKDIVYLEKDPRWAELVKSENDLRNRLMAEQERLFEQLLASVDKPAEPVLDHQPATLYKGYFIRVERNGFSGKYFAQWWQQDTPKEETVSASQTTFGSEQDAIRHAKYQIDMETVEPIDW